MKKLLSLLVAALVAFALCAPAMALTREDIIITGPAETVPFGEAFTLRADVALPDGVEIVSYQWKYYSYSAHPIDGATDAVVRVAPGDAYPEASQPYVAATRVYFCDVTFAETDTDGNVTNTFDLSSQWSRVDITPERKITFGELLKESLQNGFGFAAMTSFLSGFVLLPFFPVTFLIGFFLCFFGLIFE